MPRARATDIHLEHVQLLTRFFFFRRFQVFLAGKYIGGGDDLVRKQRDGTLLADLKAAGVEGI